jgi:hypothetical protein
MAERGLSLAHGSQDLECGSRRVIQSNFPAPAWLDLKTFAPQPLRLLGSASNVCTTTRVPTACGTPTPTAASSPAVPAAIAAQNRRRPSRPATGGRPGENKRTRPERSERRFRMFIATPVKVLRRIGIYSETALTGRLVALDRVLAVWEKLLLV